MGTTTQPAALTIPAKYLEDARSALIKEIELDGEALRANQADMRGHADPDPTDRDAAAILLRNDLAVLDQLLAANGSTTVSAEHHREPLVEMLEAMVRILSERLADVVQYGPIPMGEVLDVATQLRWAAEEAIGLEPSMAHRLTRAEWRHIQTGREAA